MKYYLNWLLLKKSKQKGFEVLPIYDILNA